MNPKGRVFSAGLPALLLTGLPAVSSATPIQDPLGWYSPTPPQGRPDVDTITTRFYRAVIDQTQSTYTYEPAYLPVFVFGEPPPGPPAPITATISGAIDLEVRTYTWVADTAGASLPEPVIESWLFLTGTSVSLSNPDYVLSLPSTTFEFAADGSFFWSMSGCPNYPEAPWAPNYHWSCTTWANYSEGLTGTSTASGFEILGSMSVWPFGPSRSYRIVANLEPAASATEDAIPSIPGPGTLPLLGAGWFLLRRDMGQRRSQGPGPNN